MKRNILVLIFINLIFLVISCLPDTQPPTTTTTVISTSQKDYDKVIAYKCVGSDATYYVFINSDKKWRGFVVGDELKGAFCVVDSKRAGVDPILNYEGIRFSEDKTILYLQPLSSAIFKKK